MSEYLFFLIVILIASTICVFTAFTTVIYYRRQEKQIEQLYKGTELLNRLQLKITKYRLEHINKVIEEIGAEDVSNKSK